MNAAQKRDQRMLWEYVETLCKSDMNFEKKGRFMDGVFLFLSQTETVSRRGFKLFCQQQADLLVKKDWIKESILHFLASMGIGYRKVAIKKEDTKTETLAKRETRQKQIIIDFVYWLNREQDLSPNTLKVYMNTAKQFYSYCDELNQDNAKRFIATLEANGNKPKTINLKITGLEKLGMFLKKNIKLKRPKIPKTLSLENIPTEREYETLLDWLDQNKPKWAFIVRLMGTTGCRVSELVQFTYEHVKKGHCTLKGKGDKYRNFFFTKEMQQYAKDKEGLICVNRYGIPIKTRGIAINLKTYAAKAGIPLEKIHPHAFRHYFAKMYLKRTKDVVGLADILGHGSVDTTRIYLQKSYDEQKKDFNKIVNW